MMNFESTGTMFADGLSCRSPSQLRNRLDGLTPEAEVRTQYARARAISCASATTKALDALSASSSRSGSLADLRKERLARAASMGDSLASSAPSWPVPLSSSAGAEMVTSADPQLRRTRLTASAGETSRPRASSMPLAPRPAMFPISETDSGY